MGRPWSGFVGVAALSYRKDGAILDNTSLVTARHASHDASTPCSTRLATWARADPHETGCSLLLVLGRGPGLGARVALAPLTP